MDFEKKLDERSSEDTKKRVAEDEFIPLLIRISSENPNSNSDYIRINKAQFTIGRKYGNDKVLMNLLISRNHCILNYDQDSDNWLVTNLSSTDTLLNDKPITKDQTEIIKDGDILQLSLSQEFMYKFTLIKKECVPIKQLRFEANTLSDSELNSVLNKQKSFVKSQENERKNLEKKLAAKQQEQEKLAQELDKLLQDQKITKICNNELNNQIIELQNKIENGTVVELKLQEKYRELLEKLEDEKLKFEEKLASEKQKWEKVLQEEKEKLAMTMVEQMEEWREEIEIKKQEECQKKIDHILLEEKNIQTKLQDEKQILEQKLKEMEEALTEKEAQQNATEIESCIILDTKETKNMQHDLEIETIDLTDVNESTSYNVDVKNCEDETIINKVNHIMDEQLTCSICSELFVNAMTLNCTHTFCRHCIDCWNKRRKDCPNCRTHIVSMTRSLVVDNFIERMLESLTPEQLEKRKQLIEERNSLAKTTMKKKTVKKRK